MAKKLKKQVQKEQKVEVNLKPTATFKLKKEYKMRMASFIDPAARHAMKKMFINGQLHEEEATRNGRKGFLEMFKGG